MELWQAALGILIASALASCIHEAGHVLVARVLGGRLRAVGIGLPWRALHFTVGGVAVFAGARPYAGACVLVEPPPTRWSRTHTALVLAAGPLATLFSSALIAIDPSPAARICAFVFLVHGVANLLPIGGRGSGLSSDGAAIIALQTGADAGAIAARTMRHQAAALRRLGFATTSREVWREARLDRR